MHEVDAFIKNDPLYFPLMNLLKLIKETDSNKQTFEIGYDNGRHLFSMFIKSSKTIFGDKDVYACSPEYGKTREIVFTEVLLNIKESTGLEFIINKSGKLRALPNSIEKIIVKRKKESVIDFLYRVSKIIESSLSIYELNSL